MKQDKSITVSKISVIAYNKLIENGYKVYLVATDKVASNIKLTVSVKICDTEIRK